MDEQVKLFNTIHDNLVDILKREPIEEEVIKAIGIIPQDIMYIGLQWGYYDTEFREKSFEFLKENIK